jgi:2-oxo-4-hydroxy-4-carboxy--5-ureidoimidazoline (OHCU) decarboxylase
VRLAPIERLNRLSGAEFRGALRPLFETADPLAKALEAAKPYPSYAALLDRAEAILAELPESQQVEVLNAHPRIGSRQVSELSYREQGSDREADDPEILRELAALNQAYEERFGFRFVVFVNHRLKSAIVPVLRERLASSRSEELSTGRREMLRIARDRLTTLG